MRHIGLALFTLSTFTACLVNPPPAEGTCRDPNDCRAGRVCLNGRCFDAGTVLDSGTTLDSGTPPVTYLFRQWRDHFDKIVSLDGSYADAGAGGDVVIMRLPPGHTPRGAFAEIGSDRSNLPSTTEGKVAGRVTFTSPGLPIAGDTGVRILNVDAPDAGSGPRSFAALVVRSTDHALLLHSEPGQLHRDAIDQPTSTSLVAGGTYFIELGWKAGQYATVRVNDAGVLRVLFDGGSPADGGIFRIRVGFQNYDPGEDAGLLGADFENWQVTNGADDVVKDGP